MKGTHYTWVEWNGSFWTRQRWRKIFLRKEVEFTQVDLTFLWLRTSSQVGTVSFSWSTPIDGVHCAKSSPNSSKRGWRNRLCISYWRQNKRIHIVPFKISNPRNLFTIFLTALRNSTCTIVVILTRVPLPIHGSLLIEVIMSVVFGRRTMADDEDVEALFRTIDMFIGNQVPGKWIVDGYPQLAKLPKWLQWWRPYGEQCFNETVG